MVAGEVVGSAGVSAAGNARISAESQHVIDSLEAHHGAMRQAMESGKLDGASSAELAKTGRGILAALSAWGVRFRGELPPPGVRVPQRGEVASLGVRPNETEASERSAETEAEGS